MSEMFASDVTPESTLRFSIEKLYAAGASLGLVESSLTPPPTTFEGLHRRAEDLNRRIGEQKVLRINAFRGFALLIAIFAALALIGSFVSAND